MTRGHPRLSAYAHTVKTAGTSVLQTPLTIADQMPQSSATRVASRYRL